MHIELKFRTDTHFPVCSNTPPRCLHEFSLQCIDDYVRTPIIGNFHEFGQERCALRAKNSFRGKLKGCSQVFRLLLAAYATVYLPRSAACMYLWRQMVNSPRLPSSAITELLRVPRQSRQKLSGSFGLVEGTTSAQGSEWR